MIVFKLSWLPWILIIGGIGLLSDGEAAGVALLLIGAVWLVLRYRSKKSGDSEPKQLQKKNPINAEGSAVSPGTCPACGAAVSENSLYCASCGKRLK